jgi:hypothetical protein
LDGIGGTGLSGLVVNTAGKVILHNIRGFMEVLQGNPSNEVIHRKAMSTNIEKCLNNKSFGLPTIFLVYA